MDSGLESGERKGQETSWEAGAAAQVTNDEGLNYGSGSSSASGDGEKRPDLRGVTEIVDKTHPYLLV